jgi:hypothetical protein
MQHDELGGTERQPADPAVTPPAAAEARPIPGEPRGGDAAQTVEAMRRDPGSVRAEDTEPYVGLQYVARLFKVVAFLVLIALGLEILLGVLSEGTSALMPLFAEVVQLGVLSAILWGAADLTLLLIDIGHDVRAARVLLGRMSARGEAEFESAQRRDRKRG